MVPGDLVGDRLEEWGQRAGPAADPGLGSYVTAWTWLHKLARAMVRPGSDRLHGRVEVDETYVGGLEEGVRSRWRIDTEVFQTITTDCHLKHPAVHQSTALVVLTMIRLLAYTLSLVFYHRQVCSHAHGPCHSFHEFAKRLAYGFVALAPDTS